MIDMQTGERRTVFLLSSNMTLSNQSYCVVWKRYIQIYVNSSLTSQDTQKNVIVLFVKNSHLNHRQIIIQWIKTIQFLACQFTTRMIPNPVIIVLCMLFKRCSLRYDLKWPSLTPVTSHNNHSLTDRHADDPGDDRDTLSILQNKHLSQKKIKHQQQCHPGHRSASGLTHPPSLSWSPLSVHTKTGIQ